MPNRWQRAETWVGLIVAAAGALAAVIVGVFTYVTFTATPLHPDSNSVPSVAGADPLKKWAGSVERGRQVMREVVFDAYLRDTERAYVLVDRTYERIQPADGEPRFDAQEFLIQWYANDDGHGRPELPADAKE